MNLQTINKIVDDLLEECLSTMNAKGAAYAGTADILDNFRRNAGRLGLAPAQVWLVYWAKHMDAIRNAISQNPENPVDKTEGLRGRIVDGIVYLWLLCCLLQRPTKEDGTSDPMTPDERKCVVLYIADHSKAQLLNHPPVKGVEPGIHVGDVGAGDTKFVTWSKRFEHKMSRLAGLIKESPVNPQIDKEYLWSIIRYLILLQLCLVEKADETLCAGKQGLTITLP